MLASGIFLCAIGFALGITVYGDDRRVCDFYLAPSTLPGAGRGVIAGKSFETGGIVEKTMFIVIDADIAVRSHLNNYVFNYDNHENYFRMIIFGGGGMHNHGNVRNVKAIRVPGDKWLNPIENSSHSSSSNDILFFAYNPISVGQELFTNYGEKWFVKRGLTEQFPTRNHPSEEKLVSIEDLEKYGHCLTHVQIGQSRIPFAGKGLFAKKPYKKDEIVVIAPVLTLPKHLIYSTANTSVLANFVLTDHRSEVTLFPVNNAVAMNHNPTGVANVQYDWYDWSSIPKEGSYYEHIQGNTLSLSEKLSLSPEELFSAPFSQLDLAFRAVRDIEEGEELTYDYGNSWGNKWNEFVVDIKAWELHQKTTRELAVDEYGGAIGLDMTTIPQFRSYIDVPDGFFPEHWLH